MIRSPISLSLGLCLMLFAMPVFAADDGGGLNAFVGALNGYIATVLFFDVFPGEGEMPFIVAWLIIGAVFLTIRFGFINLRMMGHAFNIIRGKYNDTDAKGEVTPFQALTTALSATVGLGNIAMVTVAIIIGGPGAIVWMIVAGFFGMTSKFTEVTLAQKYRRVRPDGRIMGGPMEYLSQGLAEKNLPTLGKVLAIMFAILTIGGSLGAGNAFQVSQAVGAVKNQIPFFDGKEWILGLFFATLVGVVIIGGLRRIANVAQTIVPTMIIIYIAACLWIILTNISLVPDAFATIWQSAFTLEAGIGGLIGVIVQGFKRAVFSSEAGIGSAAIAHSAACVKHPVRQGFVALYEPFIDTIVICTMTALVIVITGVYNADEFAALREAQEGAALTVEAFGTAISWFPAILSLSIILFAFSTMISWSYYGERCWSYVFGDSTSMIYRIIFVAFVMVGATVSTKNIIDFSDLLILAMAFPNFIGLYLLSGKVAELLSDYRNKLNDGKLD